MYDYMYDSGVLQCTAESCAILAWNAVLFFIIVGGLIPAAVVAWQVLESRYRSRRGGTRLSRVTILHPLRNRKVEQVPDRKRAA